MKVSLAQMITQESADRILAKSIEFAASLKLAVTSWLPGDPTRSLFEFQAEKYSIAESVRAAYAASGFLDTSAAQATNNPGAFGWLALLAEQQFGYRVRDATFATGAVVLSNSAGGHYEFDPGDVTFKNTTTGASYHNTTGGVLSSGPGTSLTLSVVSDIAGADGSAAVGEIDDLVTTLLGVTVTNPTALIGIDGESPAEVVRGARGKLFSLSPGGAREAYEAIAVNAEVTGQPSVTRARVTAASVGNVTLVIASPTGPVTETERLGVEAAVVQWANPICATVLVLSSVAKVINVDYELWVYDSVGKKTVDIERIVFDSVTRAFASRPISGDVIPPDTTGFLYRSLLTAAISDPVSGHVFRIDIKQPSSEVSIPVHGVAELGSVTAEIHIIPRAL